jgi:hypothetical protein
MTAHATQFVVAEGTAPTFVAATAADTVEVGNGKNTFLVVKNSGAEGTVTIPVPGNTSYGELNPSSVTTVAATTGEAWIPLRKEFQDSTAGVGRAKVTSAVGTFTYAVVQVG